MHLILQNLVVALKLNVASTSALTSYSKGRKTLGLRSFVANFSQAFMRSLVRRYERPDMAQSRHSALKRFCPSTIYQYNSPLPQNELT
jgi:hypothetical protein